MVRYVSSNYHHHSGECEKRVKLGTTNKQYVTVKNEGGSKLCLLWGTGLVKNLVKNIFCRTCPSYILLDGKFYADSTLIKD